MGIGHCRLNLEFGFFGELGDCDADSGWVVALFEILRVDLIDFGEIIHGLTRKEVTFR
jgi:hypothetical protein